MKLLFKPKKDYTLDVTGLNNLESGSEFDAGISGIIMQNRPPQH